MREMKLAKACGWLVAAGLPQYPQLYREAAVFSQAIDSMKADHEFLDHDSIMAVSQRLDFLKECRSSKIRMTEETPCNAATADENHCALCNKWTYDPQLGRWRRHSTDFQTPPTVHRTRNSPSCRSQTSSEQPADARSTGDDLNLSFSLPRRRFRNQSESRDEASVHLTSGYESETSPMSTYSSATRDSPRADNVTPVSAVDENTTNFDSSSKHTTTDVGSTNGVLFSNCKGRSSDDRSDDACSDRKRLSFYDNFPEVILDDPQRELERILDDLYWNIGSLEEALNSIDQRSSGHPKSPNLNGDDESIQSHGDTSTVTAQSPLHPVPVTARSQTRPTPVKRLAPLTIPAESSSLNPEDLKSAKVDSRSPRIDFAQNHQLCSPSPIHTSPNQPCQNPPNQSNRSPTLQSCQQCPTTSIPKHRTPSTTETNIVPKSSPSLLRLDDRVVHPRCEDNETLLGRPSGPLRMMSLSARELVVLRKLSVIALTALVEKHSQSDVETLGIVPDNSKSSESPENSPNGKKVFGVSLSTLLRRTGHVLPRSVHRAMTHLIRHAANTEGIFRKSGVKSHIQKLQDDIDREPASMDFGDADPYNVADVLKRYFNQLPECLLTHQMAPLFREIFVSVPEEHRVGALQAAILLLPDVNRYVLKTLLTFLKNIAEHSQQNKMSANSLSVCFLPSFFQQSTPASPAGGIMTDIKPALACVTSLIANVDAIFTIQPDLADKLRHAGSQIEFMLPSPDGSTIDLDIDRLVTNCLVENGKGNENWTCVSSPSKDVELSYRIVSDGLPLSAWRGTIQIEAPPCEVLHRLQAEQYAWDRTNTEWTDVRRVDPHTDIVQYVLRTGDDSMEPREVCLVRSWRSDLPKGSCLMVSVSVDGPVSTVLPSSGDLVIRAIVLAAHYIIEPCGAGKSRVVYTSRIDLRGHTPDWYHAVYGRLCVDHLTSLRNSFQRTLVERNGPETKL